MNMRFLATLAGLGLVLAACSTPADTGPDGDPYEDPGTSAPAEIPVEEQTVTPSLRLSEPDSNDIITLNVGGLAAGTSGLGPAALREHFTVVEDDVVKGITVEKIGTGSDAGLDIVFVVDTTGSMSPAFSSVQNSINDFVGHLAGGGYDVRVGSVTFGDAFDTISEGNTSGGVSLKGDEAPSFDRTDRPTFPLSTDLDAFQNFISAQRAVGGGLIPENSLGAVQFATDPELGWRSDAQCVLVVITDALSWNHEGNGDGIPEDSRWYPPNPAELISDLRGDCTVHAISSDELNADADSWTTDITSLTGSDATGGEHVAWELSDGEFDLTELPILDAISEGGYLVKYRGTVDGSKHEVRFVVDDGSTRGDTTIEGVY